MLTTKPNTGAFLSSSVNGSKFLLIGAFGFFASFFTGFFLFLDFLLGSQFRFHFSLGWTGYYLSRIVLFLSLTLGSFGLIGFKRKYGSNFAFVYGILVFLISVFLACVGFFAVILPFQMPGILLYINYNPSFVLSIGIFLLGITLAVIKQELPNLGKILWIGEIFILISVLTFGFSIIFWYWDFSFWLLLFGWLFAINSLATGWLFLQIRKLSKVWPAEQFIRLIHKS